MTDLTKVDVVRGLQSNLRVVFGSPQGQEIMKFLEEISHWTPSVYDSLETNEVIARDANRRLIGTIKSLLTLDPYQVVDMVNKQGE
jgi:hypothetical protein